MKRIAGMVGAVLVGGSVVLAAPVLAAPSSTITVPTPGTVGTSSPKSSLNEQDSGSGMSTDGARVDNTATQGTVKAAAVDGQVNATGTQGQIKTVATDGTETASVEAAPQMKGAAPAQ
jgi:hypothetical protein